MFSFPEKFKAKITDIVDLNSNTSSYMFEVVEGNCSYKAGQFVMLDFESPFEKSERVQRAYSVASRPNGKVFELCIERIQGGQAGTFLSSVQKDDVLDFKGPFGHCTLKDKESKQLIFAATGTGIAPIKAILEDLVEMQAENSIKVYFGMRYLKDLYYLTELTNLISNLKNAKLDICISKPETADHPYHTGRIQTQFDIESWDENTVVYACGNGNMVRDVRSKALVAGVDKKQILVEIFDS